MVSVGEAMILSSAWRVAALTASAVLLVTACDKDAVPPPAPAQSGRWESADGAYWIDIDDDLRGFSGRLPEVRLRDPSCAESNQNAMSGNGLIGMAFGEDADTRVAYGFNDAPGGFLHLKRAGDFRVLLAYPCGIDHDPVELILADDDPDMADPFSTGTSP